MAETKQEMLTQSDVLSMGWTKSMLTLLPPPTLKTNPKYKCAAPMKLWEKEVVLAAMETEEYKEKKAKADARRNGAEKAVKTKIGKLQKEVQKAIESIRIVVLPQKELIATTLAEKQEWYDNCYYQYGYNEPKSAYGADEATLKRWVVNYIRHNLTYYDETLEMMWNKTGKNQLLPIFRRAIFDRIAEAYPQYADECRRQLARKNSF